MKKFTDWLIEHDYLYDDLDKNIELGRPSSKAKERLAASKDFISSRKTVFNPEYDPDIPWSLDKSMPQEYKEKYPNWRDKIGQFNQEEIPAKVDLGKKRIVLSKYRHPPIALPINNKNISQDHHHGFKPFGGLWYSFGSKWIEWSEQVPERIRMFLHEIKINPGRVLILRNKEETSLFEKDYGSKKDNGFKYEIIIDWVRFSKDYDGIELQQNALHYIDWQENWDVPSGCIWNKQAIADTRLLYVYDVNSKKYVTPTSLGLYGGYSSKIKKPLPYL
jgi:hypothetical protein